jgi:hypothetical protein
LGLADTLLFGCQSTGFLRGNGSGMYSISNPLFLGRFPRINIPTVILS